MLFFVMLALVFVGAVLAMGFDEFDNRMKELIEVMKEKKGTP